MVMCSNKGIHGLPWVKRVTKMTRGTRKYKGLQEVTRGNRGLQVATRGYKGLLGVTKGYKL